MSKRGTQQPVNFLSLRPNCGYNVTSHPLASVTTISLPWKMVAKTTTPFLKLLLSEQQKSN